MEQLNTIVDRARARDLEAWRLLVQATQAMTYAAALGILHDSALAHDAAQECYLRAFRTLATLKESGAFISWLRRIVITVALDMRRANRATLLRLDNAVPPVLDEQETAWSESQYRLLAGALLTLNSEERRLCDRRYHGRWSTARLARDAGVDEPVMRKRLQRLRDKLRKEIEMAEQRNIHPETLQADFPARILELLARPRLTDLLDNPVGRVLDIVRGVYAGFDAVDLPEIVNLTEAGRVLGADLPYLALPGVHRIDKDRILRSDLTLPLLLTLRFQGQPMRVCAAGKAYRADPVDATHNEAFHQAEIFWLDDREHLNAWQFSGKVHESMCALVPGKTVRIVPTSFPLCSATWQLDVEQDGRWMEVLAWGVYTDRILTHLGADPSRHIAIGAAYGLERLAMLRFDLDDIRKVDVAGLA